MRIRVLPVLAATVAVALLIGCSAPTPTPMPTSSGIPTALPEEITAPHAAIDLPCDGSVNEASLGAFFAGAVPATTDLERDGGTTSNEISERQAGVQRCAWGSYQDSAFANFAVLSEAESAYADGAGWYGVNLQYVRLDQLGDDSVHECSYGYCYAEVLIGDLWVTINGVRSDLMDELDLEPLFLAFARDAVDAVRDAPRRDAWQPPSDAFRTTPGWCEPRLVTAIGGALGVPSRQDAGFDQPRGFVTEVWNRVGLTLCGFYPESASGLSGYGYLEIVPGALWAAPSLIGAPTYYDGVYEPTTDSEGTPLLVAENAYDTAIILEVDGSLAFLTYSGLGRDELIAAAAALVDALRAHPAG